MPTANGLCSSEWSRHPAFSLFRERRSRQHISPRGVSQVRTMWRACALPFAKIWPEDADCAVTDRESGPLSDFSSTEALRLNPDQLITGHFEYQYRTCPVDAI